MIELLLPAICCFQFKSEQICGTLEHIRTVVRAFRIVREKSVQHPILDRAKRSPLIPRCEALDQLREAIVPIELRRLEQLLRSSKPLKMFVNQPTIAQY